MIIGLIVAIFLFWQAAPGTGVARANVKYGEFLDLVKQDKVASINYDASNGKITGQFVKGFTQDGHSDFATLGQENQLPDADIATLNEHNVARNYKPRSTDWLATILVWVVPFALLGLIWWF
ncbi:MAG: ATP-dependent metallopeptidase FtsH/Yme1/Tma family protein, partial [Ilumatobacteraceae bacterium]